MSYELKLGKDKPRGLWMLDGSLIDYSGNSVAATEVGNAISTYPAALVATAAKSSQLANDTKVKFPSRLYKPGYDKSAFTLEAWVFQQSQNSTILSRTGQTDGLAFVNGELRFSLRMVNSTPTINYKPDTTKTIHAVAIYTRQYMSLYINGELFERLNFTPAQIADKFIAPSEEFFVAGENGPLLINGVAIYEYALSDNQILMHYQYGRDAVNPDSVPYVYNGQYIDLSYLHADTFLQETIGPSMSWTLGNMDTLVVNSQGELSQSYEGGIYKAGTWTYSFDTSYATSIQAVRLGWEGEGNFVVSTSLDGENWTAAANNVKVAGITPGTSPQQLFVRIQFPENDNATIGNLEITGYKSAAIDVPNRSVTLGDLGITREEWSPLENRCDYGTYLANDILYITPSTAGDYTGDMTWEYWYYCFDSSVGVSVPNATTYYTNGEVVGSTLVGSWNLFHILTNGTNTAPYLYVGGNMIIGRVAAYPTALTQAQCRNIYSMYTGKLMTPVAGTDSTIGLSAPSIKTYASDWSVIGSG